jgi:hypothetical protein
MNRATLTALAIALIFTGAGGAQAGSVSGQAALALAGVVAPASHLLSMTEKEAVAMLFAMNSTIPYKKKIVVTADKIVCRVSNVDITARSCDLTFGKKVKTINGRAANELFATEALAGVAPDGAAGSNFESLSKLSCTLDPQVIQDKAGGGAECTFEAAN